MRDLAERLVAHEAKGAKPSAIHAQEACQVCEKLRPHLATLMGGAGFHALLSRSLAVAKTDAPGRSMFRVNEDGSLAVSDTSEAPEDPQAMATAGIMIIARLLTLLEAFIGENLTLRMVRDVWPHLNLDDCESQKRVRK